MRGNYLLLYYYYCYYYTGVNSCNGEDYGK